jgi:hypothetical protein
MPKRKAKAPAVQTMNAAPGYGGPPPGPAENAYTGGYGAPANGQAPGGQPATFSPPSPRAPQDPFINAAFLWQLGGPVKATINGMRDATGTGNPEFQKQQNGRPPKRAWFLDFTLANGTKATGRINEGDMRHHRLWAAYQTNIVGRTVTLRLSNPGDVDPFTNKPTKAPWMIDTH